MKVLGIVIAISFLGIINIFGQHPPTRNNVFFEAGGAAFFYSINYERLLLKKADHNLGVRVGFSYLNLFDDRGRQFTGLPVGISYLKKLKNKFLETGLSFSGLIDQYDIPRADNVNSRAIKELVLIPSFRLGIRKQPIKPGLFWNALLQYSLVAVDDYKTYKWDDAERNSIPFLSLGLGYAFQ